VEGRLRGPTVIVRLEVLASRGKNFSINTLTHQPLLWYNAFSRKGWGGEVTVAVTGLSAKRVVESEILGAAGKGDLRTV